MSDIVLDTTDKTDTSNTTEPTDVKQQEGAAPAAPAPQPDPPKETKEPPVAETAEETEPAADDVGAEFSLEVPGDVPPGKVSDADLTILDQAAAAAREAGVPRSVAQLAVDSFVDQLAVFGEIDTSHYDASDAERFLRAEWRDNYDVKIKKVWKTVARLGSPFAAFLDKTRLGNDPRFIAMLADFDDLKRSRGDAQAELQKLRGDMKSDLYSQDAWKRKPAVARVAALGRVANRGERSDDDVFREQVSQKMNKQLSAASGSGAVTSTARKELNAMLADRNSALNNAGHRDHAAAVKRFQVLAATIRG